MSSQESEYTIWMSGRHTDNTLVEIVAGDINTLPVDAIVEEVRGLGIGQTHTIGPRNGVMARNIIQVRGPGYDRGAPGFNEVRAGELLSTTYNNTLLEALRIGARNVAFPTIAVNDGFPGDHAAEIALIIVRHILDSHANGAIDRVVFVVPSGADDNFDHYIDQLP